MGNENTFYPFKQRIFKGEPNASDSFYCRSRVITRIINFSIEASSDRQDIRYCHVPKLPVISEAMKPQR